jgi:hypothetical protein
MAASSPVPAKPGVYEVSRPDGKCAVSGRVIEPGEKFFTALRDGPDRLQRIDVAPEHWAAVDKSDLLGFWQTVMPHPEQTKKMFVDDAILTERFERLGDATEESKLNFRFVLGLILMRKRIVTYEGTQVVDGKEVWSMKLRGRDTPLELVNPHLGEEQVAEVSRQLTEILNEG